MPNVAVPRPLPIRLLNYETAANRDTVISKSSVTTPPELNTASFPHTLAYAGAPAE